MREPRRISEPEVEPLVRAFLERQASPAEAQAGLARIRGTLDRETAPSARRRLRVSKWWAGAATVAAAVLVACLIGLYSSPAHAQAEVLVAEAQKAHALPVDRCYLVETNGDADALAPRVPLLAQPRTTRLWVRGNRFWIESATGARKWAWGRDEQGLWLAVSPHLGIRFDSQETPEGIALLCDLYSLRLESLLADVLRDFDLQRSEPGSTPASTHFIQAELKPGRVPSRLRRATLEIDAESKLVKRLVLTRALGNRTSTTTFTLTGSQTQPDARYQLEGHLEAPVKVYSRSLEPDRRQVWLRRLGM